MLVQVLIGQECRRNHASCIFSFVWQPVAFILYIYLKCIEDGGATTIHNCHHKETGCYRKKNIFFFKIYCTPTTFLGLVNAYIIKHFEATKYVRPLLTRGGVKILRIIWGKTQIFSKPLHIYADCQAYKCLQKKQGICITTKKAK